MIPVPFSLVYLSGRLLGDFAKLRRSKRMSFLNRYSAEQLRGVAFLDGSRAKNELGRGPQISHWKRAQSKAYSGANRGTR